MKVPSLAMVCMGGVSVKRWKHTFQLHAGFDVLVLVCATEGR